MAIDNTVLEHPDYLAGVGQLTVDFCSNLADSVPTSDTKAVEKWAGVCGCYVQIRDADSDVMWDAFARISLFDLATIEIDLLYSVDGIPKSETAEKIAREFEAVATKLRTDFQA